ncbi:MAG: DUF4160 domain-containing protein [Bacteroidaceae bacterium]|nr:DUF4160 domain-containing protein [Bacteroidaceae bacterium]
MPEISRFYGIVIKMFFKPKEHEPAHIHALYNDYFGTFNLRTLEMLDGDLPNKAQQLVREWLELHTATNCFKCGRRNLLSNSRPSKRTRPMIPRIKTVRPVGDYQLFVSFDDGTNVRYDVKDDIDTLPAFRPLLTQRGLFENVRLDESRTCIYWNEEIDLPSDTIFEYGVK